MQVLAVQCLRCGDIIYSRARHDCKGCTCNGVFVDGGLDYRKISWRPYREPTLKWYKAAIQWFKSMILRMNLTKLPYKDVWIEVDATVQQLYDDWNHHKGKFGLIKGQKED